MSPESHESDQPQSIPSREELAHQLTLPDSQKNTEILEEANRRFTKTLEFLKTREFLSGKPEPEKNTPRPKTLDDNEWWDSNADHEIWEYETRMTEEELEDAHVKEFLQTAVALRIYANRQLNEYCSDKKMLTVQDNDPVKKALDELYRRRVKKSYEDLQKDFHKRFYLEMEEDEGDYEEYPYINKIDYEKYLQVADKVANAAASNSYLEKMFQVFASPQLRSSVGVQYQEKLERYMANEVLRSEVDPRIFSIELQARQYIQEIYSDSTKLDLPAVHYIDKKGLQQIQSKLPQMSHSIGGGFVHEIKYAESEVPMNLCFVVTKKGRAPIDIADTAFEELYHASGAQLAIDKNTQGPKWPGWNNDSTGSFFEEGLVGIEKLNFFKTYYNDEYFAEGTSAHRVARFASGDAVSGEVTDIWPTILMGEISKRCGGEEFIYTLRKARTNVQEAIEKMKETIDKTFGPNTYEYLAKLNGHNRNQITDAIKKLGITSKSQ